MGIHSFLKILYNDKTIEDLATTISYAELNGQAVAVDALNIIYTNMFAMQGKPLLHDGKRTQHIYITVNQIIEFLECGICTHWIFDSGVVNELKKETVEKRRKINEKNDMFITKEEIEDIKKLLLLCGITYSVVNTEAELYGAALSANKLVTGVISQDTDVLIGGGVLLRPKSINGNKFLLKIDTQIILEHLKITQQELYKIAVVMGCDFCKKTPRIGPKTVMKKLNDILLTPEQDKAIEFFSQKLGKSNVLERSDKNLKPNPVELRNWLTELEFDTKKIQQLEKVLN